MAAGLDRLEAQLREPLHRVALPELLDLWQHDDIVVICHRPANLEDCPDLPLRIRGALGNALEEVCAREKSPDPFDRPSAHHLMFKWNPPKRGAVEVARPYVVRADVRGDSVEVRVRLFGMAGYHAPVVMRALLAALEGGVSVRNHASRAAFTPLEARFERFDGAAHIWAQGGTSATLRLLTPVIIRRNQDLRIAPLSLFRSALRRTLAIAPWMHCDLSVDEPALLAAASRFDSVMAGIHSETWNRTSRNKPGQGIPMNGYGGTITVTGQLDHWATILDLSQFASLGGECALGFGAVQLILYP